MDQGFEKPYAVRINRVLDYIDHHLDDDLTVEALSQIAHFSKYHFHRQFSEYTGVNAFKLIRLMHLKRAAYQLVFRKDMKIIAIALDAHFENSESFSRAFKRELGQTPSEFRKEPSQKPWLDNFQIPIRESEAKMNIQIINFPETKIAVYEHLGPPTLINKSVGKFIQWRKENNLHPSKSKTFNILHNDPATTDTDQYRMDICAEIQKEVADNPFGVISKIIPGGECAFLRQIGSWNNLGESIRYLYADAVDGN